jgi:hypothetical protein
LNSSTVPSSWHQTGLESFPLKTLELYLEVSGVNTHTYCDHIWVRIPWSILYTSFPSKVPSRTIHVDSRLLAEDQDFKQKCGIQVVGNKQSKEATAVMREGVLRWTFQMSWGIKSVLVVSVDLTSGPCIK